MRYWWIRHKPAVRLIRSADMVSVSWFGLGFRVFASLQLGRW